MTPPPETVRPRAYQDGVFVWRFRQIPERVELNQEVVPNPVRNAAVFVVHGIGNQTYLETAETLRDGFEDVFDQLKFTQGMEKTPPPFTFDGYWANYDNLEDTFKDECKTLEPREKELFSSLWKLRSFSTVRTFSWFAKELARLVLDKEIRQNIGLLRWVMYWGLLCLGILSLGATLLRYPRVLSRVLGDVRFYLAPQGLIERAIVQRIDRRVGERFLQLLGLDWNFKTLPAEDKLHISGDTHVFTRVTWVAHSLGSVISYNVISDLFARCHETRESLKLEKNSRQSLSAVERQNLLENVDKVEAGLHRFITIGSPLEKIALLFPKALRPWPEVCARKMANPDQRNWWTNFYHIWDPVSGRLLQKDYYEVVRNLHSRLWRIPGLAHLSYWHDPEILTYIFSRTYGQDVLPQPPIQFLGDTKVKVWRRFSLLVMFPVLTIGVAWGIFLVAKWIIPNGASAAKHLFQLLMRLLGL